VKASTLVVAEHDRGKLKDSSLSAIAAIGGFVESSDKWVRREQHYISAPW
jgi:hypothetical protein